MQDPCSAPDQAREAAAARKSKYVGKPLDMTRDFQEKCFAVALMLVLAIDQLYCIYLDIAGIRKITEPPAIRRYKEREKEGK